MVYLMIQGRQNQYGNLEFLKEYVLKGEHYLLQAWISFIYHDFKQKYCICNAINKPFKLLNHANQCQTYCNLFKIPQTLWHYHCGRKQMPAHPQHAMHGRPAFAHLQFPLHFFLHPPQLVSSLMLFAADGLGLQKGCHPESVGSQHHDPGLRATCWLTRHWFQTWPAWYTARLMCSSSVSLVWGGGGGR